MNYYEQKLTYPQKLFYTDLCAAVRERKKTVKATPGLTIEEFRDTVSAVHYDHPEFWYHDFHHYSHYDRETRYEMILNFRYSPEETAEKQKKIDRVVARICERMKQAKASSITEKCLFIHNYIVKNCTYNYDALDDSDAHPDAYNIEGLFLHGRAVCLGVSMAFRYLCSAVGVNTCIARGVSLHPGKTDYERHAWNLIFAGDACTYIDTTWDMCLSEGCGFVRYDYFFLSEIDMMRDHQYVGYPLARQFRSTYFERTNTLFTKKSDLRNYVLGVLRSAADKGNVKKLRLYFRMKNKDETREGLTKFIVEIVRANISGPFTYCYSYNDVQSVFWYEIEFK